MNRAVLTTEARRHRENMISVLNPDSTLSIFPGNAGLRTGRLFLISVIYDAFLEKAGTETGVPRGRAVARL